MATSQKSVLQDMIGITRGMWQRRGGRVPEAVMNTIDAIYKDETKRPLVVKRAKHATGWLFVMALAPGDCFSDFRKIQPYMQEATGGAVQIEKQGKAIYVRVLTEELKASYPFEWGSDQYSKYDKLCLPVPFGYSAAGLIVKDLADAPNLLIAGHPGAGKSNFLHVLAAALLLARPIQLCIIDRKKLEYGYLREHALVVTNDGEALMLLDGINAQLDKRLNILAKAGVVKAQDFEGDMPFIVLVIDELAELDDEDCQERLNRIVRLGRAAGICVVAATQRPSSTMFKKWGDSKAMFAASLCFHVRDEVNSRMVLDNDAAALIPNVPGRAVYQWDTQLEVQAMYLPIKKARQLLSGIEGVRMDDFIKSPKRLPPR